MDGLMDKEMNLKIKQKFVKDYKTGYPLISKESIVNSKDLKNEGTIINLVDERNVFIGKGYYGKQNKGLGWILSLKEHDKIGPKFFEDKIKQAIEDRQQFYN